MVDIEPINESHVLSAGLPAPSFSLQNFDGNEISLASLLHGGLVLLYFCTHVGDPGVTDEIRQLTEYQSRFSKLGITPAIISKDSPSVHQKFAKKFNTGLYMLTDNDFRTSQLYGVHNASGLNSRVAFILSKDGEVVRVFDAVRMRPFFGEIYQNIRQTIVP